MRIYDLKQKEVINECDCKRLGYVNDILFNECTGCIEAIIVPGICRLYTSPSPRDKRQYRM
ncbi:MAG: PRC-barrel domain-containing protein, partial [Lachnospiraceae bacterium]|nr:PRC-barrel domain-containing protein [Lachnospiraceae bacterium]